MSRCTRARPDEAEANVWPAVTDSVLLVASVFIILAVTTMVFFVSAQSVAMVPKPKHTKARNDRPLLSFGYAIPEGVLFATSEFELKDPARAEKRVTRRLLAIAAQIDQVRAQAEAGYGKDYFIVIEIAGHTDAAPYPLMTNLGMVNGNWGLSGKRAATLVNLAERILLNRPQLREKLRVTENPQPGDTILRASGYCSQLPVSQNGREEVDRRVEIIVHAQPAYALTTRDRALR